MTERGKPERNDEFSWLLNSRINHNGLKDNYTVTDLNIMNAVINYKIPASSVGGATFTKLEAAGSNLGTCSSFLLLLIIIIIILNYCCLVDY